MGVRTTYFIKKKLALKVIRCKLELCTNGQLADMLELFNESEYRNYWVGSKKEQKRTPLPVIKTINDFNTNDY